MSSTADDAAQVAEVADRSGRDLWTLFAFTWAAAVLFHLVGNPTLAPQWGRILLGASALVVLARPRTAWLSVPMAFAVLVNVWLEAPVLGNHWLLHGLIAVVVGASVLTAGGRSAPAFARAAGPLRLTLLAFYAFAAFAKLNSDFFDPAVSCAVFYLQESADSWGAYGLVESWPTWAERGVAGVVAAVELSIPVLLVLRRTRRVGVAVALTFHYVLAFDRTHQFFDFSSVLVVLFLLFLDPATVTAGLERGRALRAAVRRRWSSGPGYFRLVALLLTGVTAAAAASPSPFDAAPTLRELGVAIWLVYGAVLIAGVVLALQDEPGAPEPLAGDAPRWLLVVPALALLNGLTPYLEIKSSASWNMYGNLAVIDGESNHYVVRSGLPLTDGHERLVRILDSDDPLLDFYVDSEWLLPERQLLDFLADRPDVTVEGTIDGDPVDYRGGERSARPTWQQKFQVFRAVDGDGPVGCQPSFGPAR